jgi:hypothetical protein
MVDAVSVKAPVRVPSSKVARDTSAQPPSISSVTLTRNEEIKREMMAVIMNLRGPMSLAVNQPAVSPGFVSHVAFCVRLKHAFETGLVWLMRR